jgi:hypothetical protein
MLHHVVEDKLPSQIPLPLTELDPLDTPLYIDKDNVSIIL